MTSGEAQSHARRFDRGFGAFQLEPPYVGCYKVDGGAVGIPQRRDALSVKILGNGDDERDDGTI
jgi:hypothetical protein